MRVLDLRFEGARLAAEHQAIRGLRVLGRGTFSIIYDAGENVRKLTLDGASVKFLTGHRNKLTALPKIHRDYGIVGRFKEAPIHLIEMEKLKPINRHRREGYYAGVLCRLVSDHMPVNWVQEGRANLNHRKMLTAVVKSLERDGRFDGAIIDAIDYMGDCLGGTHFGLDFHVKNIMQRKSGEMVLVDPVADYALYDLM